MTDNSDDVDLGDAATAPAGPGSESQSVERQLGKGPSPPMDIEDDCTPPEEPTPREGSTRTEGS